MLKSRLRPDAGIAIAAILFVIALLALIGGVIAAGSSNFSTASVADRVQADIVSQANLIRSKISECNLMYGTNSNYDGYPSSDPVNGTLVSALNCTGDPGGMQSVWSGERPATLPPPTGGFNNWYYINTNATGLGGSASGGRCVWITPTSSNPGVVAGLSKAASKFSSGTSCTPSCPPEVVYDPASTSQKFVVWITLPSGSPNSNCLP